MKAWKIEYKIEVSPRDDYFIDWWEITNGDKTYKSYSKKDAEWLCNFLNKGAAEG